MPRSEWRWSRSRTTSIRWCIRKVERKGGKLVNTVVKTYPQVSQFWTYDPKAFLAAPVYSRDVPPSKNLEP